MCLDVCKCGVFMCLDVCKCGVFVCLDVCKCGVFVCLDVCCVFVVVGCFFFLGVVYFVKWVCEML